MKLKTTIALALITVTLVACGPRVEVPVAHVGKVLTPQGFESELIRPSRFRLDFCWPWQACDQLVILETPDVPFMEEMELFMPEDKLQLTIETRFNAIIDPANVEYVFERQSSTKTEHSRVNKIPFAQVYNTYGKDPVRGVVRNVLSEYNIQTILVNRSRLAVEVAQKIEERLAENKAPLRIVRFELAKVQPPEIIIKAQEAAAEREIDIQKAEAEASIDLTKAERDLEVAKKQRLVRKERALTLREEQEIAAEVVSPAWLEMRRLEVLEKLAASQNTIFISPDLLNNVEKGVGDELLHAKMLGKELRQ